MVVRAAGLLLFRVGERGAEVFLVHPGGPYWAKKNHGAWSIPKGLVNPGEEELRGAVRELKEETGLQVEPGGLERDLGVFRLRSGKQLHAWALEHDFDAETLTSNTFELEWPLHSGRKGTFPEVDRGAWFARDEAVLMISPAQRPALEALYAALTADQPRRSSGR